MRAALAVALLALVACDRKSVPAAASTAPPAAAALSPDLIARIDALRASLADVDTTSREEWIEGIAGDNDPELEVFVWEDVATAYRAYCDGKNLPIEKRKEAYALLLDRSYTSDDEALRSVKPKHLTEKEARAVLDLYAPREIR